MASKSDDYFTNLADTVERNINKRADRLADRLRPVMHSGDVGNVTKADFHEMIAQNWNDPEWRAQKSFAMGPVKFVMQALEAHGLPTSLLKDNAKAIVDGYGNYMTDANAQLMDNLNTPGDSVLPKTVPAPPDQQVDQPDAKLAQAGETAPPEGAEPGAPQPGGMPAPAPQAPLQ